MPGSNFPSFSFNFRKSQMRSLIFSSRLGGPDVLHIKMSYNYGRFEILGSLGRAFRAKL